jgi:hypothetical protein
VTVIVGVVPATLLYRQNARSTEREAAERRQLREAEVARAAREAEERDDAERYARLGYLRFLRITDKISSTYMSMPSRLTSGLILSADDRMELADAFAEITFTYDPDVRAAAVAVRKALDDMVFAGAEHGELPTDQQETEFRELTEAFLRAARRAVG